MARGVAKSRSFRGESGKLVVAEVGRWRGGFGATGLGSIENSERRWRWLDPRGLIRKWRSGHAEEWGICGYELIATVQVRKFPNKLILCVLH